MKCLKWALLAVMLTACSEQSGIDDVTFDSSDNPIDHDDGGISDSRHEPGTGDTGSLLSLFGTRPESDVASAGSRCTKSSIHVFDNLPERNALDGNPAGSTVVPPGCCHSGQDCAGFPDARCEYIDGSVFPGWNRCVESAGNGRCWTDGDCLSGMKCVGAAACACGQECGLEWEGAGICILQDASCVVVPAIGVERCRGGQAYRFDGTACVQCQDCCLDGPFGEYLFPDVAGCIESCHPGVRCQPWGGNCDGETVPGNWWLFDGTGCRQSDSCDTPGAVGVYPDESSCAAECADAVLKVETPVFDGKTGHRMGNLVLEGQVAKYIPVDAVTPTREATIGSSDFRSLFELAATIDWKNVSKMYSPGEIPGKDNGFGPARLTVMFGSGTGSPVYIETGWYASSNVPADLLAFHRMTIELLMTALQ